jgi:hypothetical protein
MKFGRWKKNGRSKKKIVEGGLKTKIARWKKKGYISAHQVFCTSSGV